MVFSLDGVVRLRVPQVVAPFGVPVEREGVIRGEFLKGPIPLSWLSEACNPPGKSAVAVGLAVWFESGRKKRKSGLSLTGPIVGRFGVSPSAKHRALAALEAAGLIKVVKRGKKNPLVTILERGPSETPPSPPEGSC